MKAEPMRPSHRTAARRLLLASLLAFAPAPALAGGGPETTVVVVNGDSPLSLRLANEYAHLRRFPPGRICILEDVPAGPVIGVEAFRETSLADCSTPFGIRGKGTSWSSAFLS